MTTTPAMQQETGAENILWDLSVYFDGVDDPRIDGAIQEVEDLAAAFAADYRGKVATLNAAQLAEAYARYETIHEASTHIETFAYLNYYVNTTDTRWGALVQRLTEVSASVSQRLVFLSLEWNAIEEEQAQALLSDPVLSTYRYHMEIERLYKPYQLSEPEEKLLIEKSVTGKDAWQRLFNQILSDLMVDYEGEKQPFESVISKSYHASERDVRIKATDAVTTVLATKKKELTYIFNVLTAEKASDDRLRGYPEWITSRHLYNRTSKEMVDALTTTVKDGYDLVARHYRIKRALLGYDELFDYDRYAPLALKESSAFYSWERAKQIVIDAYTGFDPQMGEIAAKFFDKNWIHAPVMPGKRGGAFASYGTTKTNPWIFLNYTGVANDVKTLAHEMGHGIHMYLSGRNQTLFSMFTPMTTAEMASVFGEMIVFNDLVAKESDQEIQLGMITEKVEGTFATVFRQISLYSFEDSLHKARRSEGELTTERLNELWLASQNDMFQNSVTLRDEYGLWWSYISHFIDAPGYVYAYAFGELLVMALYGLYEEQGADFIPRYIELLSAGDSDYPVNLLARIGVDLTDPAFWHKGMDEIRKLVDWEESLARSLYPEKFSS